MDYLKILHENPDLADEFDSLFDFFLLDELSPRDDAEGRCTFSLPGMVRPVSLIIVGHPLQDFFDEERWDPKLVFLNTWGHPFEPEAPAIR